MFTITDPRNTPAERVTDRDGADAAWLELTDEGFVLEPSLRTSSDTVLVRGDERVTITYNSEL